MILYRILSFFVNMFCSILAVFTLLLLFIAFSYPAFFLQCFLMGATALYAWFANRFFVRVVTAKETMTKKQKDLLQVNAIVAFVFSTISIADIIYLFVNPGIINSLLQQLPSGPTVPVRMVLSIFTGLGIFCLLLTIHIVWTYLLLRKHKEYFQN